MREEDVDQLIAAWDQRLGRVDENLIALEAEPTYQMLAGGARATLKGTTKDRVVPALDALGELFEHRERLNTVVSRAKELRAELSFWNKDEKLAEIAALLGGPSITLGTRQMPVAQRNLLDPAATEVSVVPEQVLAEMVRAYQVARDAVAEVAAAWARLEPRLAELEREVADAQKEAAALDQVDATRDAVARVVTELGRVRALVSNDPLGVQGRVDLDIAPTLRELTSALAELAAHQASVTRGLGEANALLAKLDVASRAAVEATSRAEREIQGPPAGDGGRASRHEVARGLLPWREKIAAAARAGRFRAADVGLARWLEVARGAVDAELEVVEAIRAAEAQRTELIGRLSARRAQAVALAGRGLIVPAELEQLARDAEATLRGRPTDLAKAQREVDTYEGGVRTLGAKARAD